MTALLLMKGDKQLRTGRLNVLIWHFPCFHNIPKKAEDGEFFFFASVRELDCSKWWLHTLKME